MSDKKKIECIVESLANALNEVDSFRERIKDEDLKMFATIVSDRISELYVNACNKADEIE